MSGRFLKILIITVVSMVFGLGITQLKAETAEEELAGPPEKQVGQEEQKQDVVIQGVQRLKVKVEKPEPDLTFDVDEIAVPYVITEDSVLDVSPSSMEYPSVSVPSILNSPVAVSPHIQMFRKPPIITLNPRYNGKVGISKWRLRITDGFGNVFKDYSGTGSLPKKIVWDGMGKTQNMLDVGTSYSYIFSIIDVASNPTSQMGKPIVLESLIYEENNAIVAMVVSEAIFDTQGTKTVISDKGKLYIKEICDLLTIRQNFPLVIETYFGDVDDANYKGEIIQEYISELLVMPKKQIKVVGQKSRRSKIVFKLK